MAYDITEGNDLFVIEETNCRGDVHQNKFKVQVPLVKRAVEYALLSKDEKEEKEEEIGVFLDSFENYSITMLLASIICCQQFIPNINPKSFLHSLEVRGKFGVEGEEQNYGVGLTKELAYQAFCEIKVEVIDDEDWD